MHPKVFGSLKLVLKTLGLMENTKKQLNKSLDSEWASIKKFLVEVLEHLEFKQPNKEKSDGTSLKPKKKQNFEDIRNLFLLKEVKDLLERAMQKAKEPQKAAFFSFLISIQKYSEDDLPGTLKALKKTEMHFDDFGPLIDNLMTEVFVKTLCFLGKVQMELKRKNEGEATFNKVKRLLDLIPKSPENQFVKMVQTACKDWGSKTTRKSLKGRTTFTIEEKEKRIQMLKNQNLDDYDLEDLFLFYQMEGPKSENGFQIIKIIKKGPVAMSFGWF